MSLEEDLQRISKPKGFGETELPSFEDLLLPEDIQITSTEIIKSYGRQLDLIRQHKDPDVENRCEKNGGAGGELSYTELAAICGFSVPAVKDIIMGKNKSINTKICNHLARYFHCTPYYLLGLAKKYLGVLIDKKEFTFLLLRVDPYELLNVTQAEQWARIDPELFKLLEKVFHLDSATRKTIRKVLDLITK